MIKEKILGYVVDNRTIKSCVDDIFLDVKNHQGKRWLACLNPHSYVVALNDPEFSLALKSADLLIADGIGVVMASRVQSGKITERVTGSDIFFGLLSRMDKEAGMSVFFLGSTEETLAAIRVRMAQDYPNICVVGTFSPPFRAEYSLGEIEEMINTINLAEPDVLWIGMTAPKQEKWIYANIDQLDVKFAGAIGAVFDFYTGKVRRSHPVLQHLGLEWMPRLIQQPRRLWRRTFISAPVFVGHLMKEYIKNIFRAR